mmetsp:Transcript_30748/g.61571  ORF Transcript_30748/g.61571 Transcript_30748/m.61571 type:complete len:203 (-) Transcript_30748:133-741(-)
MEYDSSQPPPPISPFSLPAAAARSASSPTAFASRTPAALRMTKGNCFRRSTPIELMRTTRFFAPPVPSFQAASTFLTPWASTAWGVFPPRQARVGKAVVPVTTTSASQSSSTVLKLSGSVVSARTISTSELSVPAKNSAARSGFRQIARTLHAPRSARRRATSLPMLPLAPITATRSSFPIAVLLAASVTNELRRCFDRLEA